MRETHKNLPHCYRSFFPGKHKKAAAAVEEGSSRYFTPCRLQGDVGSLNEVNGTHAQELNLGLKLILPVTSWKATC